MVQNKIYDQISLKPGNNIISFLVEVWWCNAPHFKRATTTKYPSSVRDEMNTSDFGIDKLFYWISVTWNKIPGINNKYAHRYQ